MDLFAYAQIDDLAKIAKDNGIEIPRLRGYRLMKDEEPVSQEEIKDIINNETIDIVKTLCCARPFWNPKATCHEYSRYTDYLRDFYLIKDGKKYVGIRWNRIHGKKRKILKFEIKISINIIIHVEFILTQIMYCISNRRSFCVHKSIDSHNLCESTIFFNDIYIILPIFKRRTYVNFNHCTPP